MDALESHFLLKEDPRQALYGMLMGERGIYIYIILFCVGFGPCRSLANKVAFRLQLLPLDMAGGAGRLVKGHHFLTGFYKW